MAVEHMPPTAKQKQAKQNRVILARGEKWQRAVDPEEIRLAEGTVDENGIRHIEFVKDDQGAYNRQQMRNYQKLGYERTDHVDYVDMSIPDSVYKEKIESAQHATGIARVQKKHKADPEEQGLDHSEFVLTDETVSSKDL